jgi:phage-related protein
LPIYEAENIPGRNGRIVFETGSYENRVATAKCFALKKENVVANIQDINKFLMSVRGYRKLETSNDPSCFWMARVENGAQIEPRLNRLAPFEVSFDCKPQKFLKSGLSSIKTTNGGKIYNEYGFETQPLLAIRLKAGNHNNREGSGTVTIGKKTIYIKTYTWSYDELAHGIELNRYNNQLDVLRDITLEAVIENLYKIGISADDLGSALDALEPQLQKGTLGGEGAVFAELLQKTTDYNVSMDDIWSALIMPDYQWDKVLQHCRHHNGTSVLRMDSETMETWDELSSRSRNVNAPEFLTLLPGENKISWSGDVIGVDVVPRWWCL